GATYDVSVGGMSANGTVTASVLVGAAQDAAGDISSASTGTDNSVTYDTIAPAVTINVAASQANPTNPSLIHFIVVFGEPVPGFGTSGVSLGGTALPSIDFVSLVAGSTYDVAVGNSTFKSGTITASVFASSAHDAAGNRNTAATSTNNTVTYDAI